MLETVLKIIRFLSLLTVWISFCPSIMQWLRVEGTSRPLMSGGILPANKRAVGLVVMLLAGWATLFYHALSSLVFWYLPGFFKNQEGYEAVAAISVPALILAVVVLERMFSMSSGIEKAAKVIDPVPTQEDTQPHLNPLSAVSAQLKGELEAAGLKVTDRPAEESGRLTATFTPRRRREEGQP